MLLTIWSLIVIVPLLWVVLSSFKTTKEILASPFTLPAHWSFDNYAHAWTDAGIRQFFLNTVIVVGVALVARHAAGGDVRLRARAVRVPRQPVHLLPDARRADLPDLPGDRAAVLRPEEHRPAQHPARADHDLRRVRPPVHGVLPLRVLQDPAGRVYEAAQIDGAGEWRTFFQVMLPMARPGMASVAIFNFLGLWNQFLLPVALNTDPDKYVLTQGMASFASQAGYAVDFGALFAAVVITVVPVLVVYIIFQRRLEGSVSQGHVPLTARCAHLGPTRASLAR